MNCFRSLIIRYLQQPAEDAAMKSFDVNCFRSLIMRYLQQQEILNEYVRIGCELLSFFDNQIFTTTISEVLRFNIEL